MPNGEGGLQPRPGYPAMSGQRSWITRPRLLRRFAGPAGEVPPTIVLVSAPAGAGKSVLTRQWLQVDERQHLEIPLVSALDEPTVLAGAFTEALATVGPSARRSHAGTISTARDYVLVVDDVHLLRNPDCHAVLRAVCDGTPAGSQVVLISREEAPPWVERARAEDRLVEVTAKELRFHICEAAELLEAMDVASRGVDLDDIVERTEGWAVGLKLAGSAMRRGTGWSSLIVPDVNRNFERSIRGYVTTEVLAPLNPELQSFVLRTSVLDELEPGLCDAVLLREDSLAQLRQLQEQLQLVIPLDDGRRVRYHHLLRETLLVELSRKAPAETPILHARASRWYADTGLLDEAIRHAKAAGDLSEVGRLVRSGCGKCIGSGDKARPALWLADLSEGEIAHDRWLTLAAAWVALQSGLTDESDLWILRAEGHAGEGWAGHARDDPYAAELAVIVALVGRDGLDATTTLASSALDGLPAESPYRPAAHFILGVALTLNRDVESGRRALVEAERTAQVLRVPTIRADALSWQGVLALIAGDVPNARRTIEGATGVVEDNRLERVTPAAHCVTAQALLQALANDPAAPATLAAARRLTTELHETVPWFTVCWRLIQARAAVSLGDGVLARQLLTEASARMTPDLQDSLANDLCEDTERVLRHIQQNGPAPRALTAAELRVLQFLPSHLQLPQIGEHLFVSANTVKTHVMAIHRKLGVTSRDQVVARARALGLIDGIGAWACAAHRPSPLREEVLHGAPSYGENRTPSS